MAAKKGWTLERFCSAVLSTALYRVRRHWLPCLEGWRGAIVELLLRGPQPVVAVVYGWCVDLRAQCRCCCDRPNGVVGGNT